MTAICTVKHSDNPDGSDLSHVYQYIRFVLNVDYNHDKTNRVIYDIEKTVSPNRAAKYIGVPLKILVLAIRQWATRTQKERTNFVYVTTEPTKEIKYSQGLRLNYYTEDQWGWIGRVRSWGEAWCNVDHKNVRFTLEMVI